MDIHCLGHCLGITGRNLLLNELMGHNADFLCLQEVDIAQYEDCFMPLHGLPVLVNSGQGFVTLLP